MSQAAADAVRAANPEATIEITPSDSPNYLSQLAIQLFIGIGARCLSDLWPRGGRAGAGRIRAATRRLRERTGMAGRSTTTLTRAGVTVQDHLMGHSVGSQYVYFLFYRKDLFEAAGLPADWQPQTREEIIDGGQSRSSNIHPDVDSLFALCRRQRRDGDGGRLHDADLFERRHIDGRRWQVVHR